jgi:hypothetical protein
MRHPIHSQHQKIIAAEAGQADMAECVSESQRGNAGGDPGEVTETVATGEYAPGNLLIERMVIEGDRNDILRKCYPGVWVGLVE